jgi:hypothetical protein
VNSSDEFLKADNQHARGGGLPLAAYLGYRLGVLGVFCASGQRRLDRARPARTRSAQDPANAVVKKK